MLLCFGVHQSETLWVTEAERQDSLHFRDCSERKSISISSNQRDGQESKGCLETVLRGNTIMKMEVTQWQNKKKSPVVPFLPQLDILKITKHFRRQVISFRVFHATRIKSLGYRTSRPSVNTTLRDLSDNTTVDFLKKTSQVRGNRKTQQQRKRYTHDKTMTSQELHCFQLQSYECTVFTTKAMKTKCEAKERWEW